MPPKSIAIPPNPSAQKGRRRPVMPAEPMSAESVALLHRQPARAIMPAPRHRYHVGERLRMGNGGQALARASAACKVVFLLPYEGSGPLLYRVRSDAEAFERVVSEADLSRG